MSRIEPLSRADAVARDAGLASSFDAIVSRAVEDLVVATYAPGAVITS